MPSFISRRSLSLRNSILSSIVAFTSMMLRSTFINTTRRCIQHTNGLCALNSAHSAAAASSAAASSSSSSFSSVLQLVARSAHSSACHSAPAAAASSTQSSSSTSQSDSSMPELDINGNPIVQPYRRPAARIPEQPLQNIYGSYHRPRVVRDIVPASLTPEEQGSGESFIPTLLRPVEWIRATQPALPTPLPWTPQSKRTGLLGTKLGMMQVWDHHGVRLPITVIKIDSQVVGHNNQLAPKKKTLGLQMGIGVRKFKNTPKSQLVICMKNGVHPKRKIIEFAVSPDAMLPVGWTASVRHFVPGQFLDVTGTSTGKGFQGGMKKWGFGGLNASHGVSVSHRSIGATGSRQDPGRVFKNKKMPGRMGGTRVTKINNKLFKIDVEKNLLYIVGTIPGHKGSYVIVRDAVKKPWHPDTPPPFPTYQSKKGDEQVKEIICAPDEVDPFAYGLA